MLIKLKKPNCISHDRGNKVFQSRLSSCIQNKTTPSDLQPIFVMLSTGIWSTKHFLYYQITRWRSPELQPGASPSRAQQQHISWPSLSAAPWQGSYQTLRTRNQAQEIQAERAQQLPPPQHFTKLTKLCYKGQSRAKGMKKIVTWMLHILCILQKIFFSLYCPSYHYFV